MGGIGSGQWYRWDKQTTTSKVKRIDIRYMKQRGLLIPNTQGSLSWTRGGEPCGDIRYTCYPNHLQLNYRFKRTGEDWQPVEQTIRFDTTPCNYGGERKWFLCPRCNRRVAILYGEDVLFLCRHCYQLPYASQNESTMDRLIEQRHKLGERIFEHYEGGEGWGKKKGMHQKTFDRLYAKFSALDRQWCRAMARCFPEFKGKDFFG